MDIVLIPAYEPEEQMIPLAKQLKEEPPQHLRELAEKAKFSPYTLTEEELKQLDVYLETAVARLKKKNIFSRFWYTWILALY